MASGIYVAMQGARAQEHRLETLSHDLANALTPGFKRQAAIYRQVHHDVTRMGDPNQAMGVHHPVRFLPEDRLPVLLDDRYTQFEQGPMRNTGNDLDLALNGEGFFVLGGPDGPLYTRNGSFALARGGALVDQRGFPVLDDAGKPVVLPNEQGRLRISQQGDIFSDDQPVGRLAVVRFDDPQALLRAGDSGWTAPPALAPVPITVPDIKQGHLESANVNVVRTMVELIKTNRIFELNTRALQAYKAMDDQATREVGRSS
ncbi:MAG: flagellar basal-body rod protein FlgF [Myxococcales bacterium]|nr:flagellar basal-body rod protein FlgF [Myxococcales bacterium]